MLCVNFYFMILIRYNLNINRYLTNEGIEYLRIFLHLPPEIVPATLKRSVRTETVRRGAVGRTDAPTRTPEDRSAYRRAPTTPGAPHDKKADVGPGSADLEFVSIFIYVLVIVVRMLYMKNKNDVMESHF